MAVSFDLFGTLVRVDRPDEPSVAIGRELAARGVPVPDEWATAYRTSHVDAPRGAEVALPTHVDAALSSRGIDAPGTAVRRAVAAAFDVPVETRPGAIRALERTAECGPVAICSNCSVPGLVARTLARSLLPVGVLDAVVTSVGCGRRKPDRRCFEAVASALDVPMAELTHVGDDPRTDGGIEDAGGRAVLLTDRSLREVPAEPEVGP